MRRVKAVAVTAAAVLAGCGAGAGAATHGNGIDPANFTSRVDNPWFPLKPGARFVYKGTDDKGKPTRDVMRVTHKTKLIDGVRCVVLDDRVYNGAGRLHERTNDYYAQDKNGTVWYMGEDTAELDRHGRVTTREGTWHSGVNGGRGGIFMPAHPRVGEQHRQEYLKGHAEDVFRVVRVTRTRVMTEERSRLEPGVVGGKTYRRGVGQVAEHTLKGDKENLRLVSHTK
jgi:hypothetical protein